MPLDGIWTNPPGANVDYKEGNAKLLQFRIEQKLSTNHNFFFRAYKVSLKEGCEVSSKTLPLVIQMIEQQNDKKFVDIYSFDNHGACLSHGYTRYENGKLIVNEEHDTDVSRLVEKSKLISELARGYPIPFPLGTHSTIIDLLEGFFGS